MNRRRSYSIEWVNQQKVQREEEIKISKKRIQNLTQQLFAPIRSNNKIDSMMQHINMGIATYDGIMTGLKILRRMQSFFGKRKKCL